MRPQRLRGEQPIFKQALPAAYDIQLWPSLTFILFEFTVLLLKESRAAGSRLQAARLRAQFESELPPDVVAVARAHGQSKTLDRVVTELLQGGES